MQLPQSQAWPRSCLKAELGSCHMGEQDNEMLRGSSKLTAATRAFWIKLDFAGVVSSRISSPESQQ